MFREISAKELDFNAFKMIGDEWMLVGAKNGEKVNAMTASWGSVGVMWGKNVAYVFIRPQRFTKELVDKEGRFSLSVLPEEYKDTLMYFGRVSGRVEDKVKVSGLKVADCDGVPYFEEANKVLVLKTLYRQQMNEESAFCDCVTKHYPNNDYHYMYVAEIEKVLVKD